MKKLLVNVLESVDKDFLLDKKYARIRRKEFSKKPGIYALYDKKGKLYYVDRTLDLNERLKQHLKHNKHSGKWDKFYIFFTKKEYIAREVKAIVLSLLWNWAQPKGNTQKTKVKVDKSMKNRIVKAMNQINKEMMGDHKSQSGKSKLKPRIRKTINRPNLKGLVKEKQTLKAEYKRSGKTFHAVLLPSGEIEYQGKKYVTLSCVAKAASGKGPNGWTFWTIQNESNKWITLDEFVTNKDFTTKTTPRKRETINRPSLKGLVKEKQTLKHEYKRSGKILHAILWPSGEIEYQGKKYVTLSCVAKAASGKGPNGWTFWKIQNESNKWITLDEFVTNKDFTTKTTPRKRETINRPSLKGLVKEKQTLKHEYKRSGKILHAILWPSGEIEYQGNKYSKPSPAAKAASGKEQNGWTFWTIKNKSNKWITLNEFVTNKGSTTKAKLRVTGQRKLSSKKEGDTNKEHFFNKEILPLRAKHKRHIYTAKLLSDRKSVQYEDKTYSSPSGAARAITNYKINGWTFWSAQVSANKWVKLKKLFINKAS